ncbi:unnamed protein product [Aphanomyces euteiches]|nr:hypothetical protein Ae201684P_022431 [Aphanomyces euteiches]
MRLFVSATLFAAAASTKEEYLIFQDDFNSGFDLSVWKHDITLGGNGNREFQVYVNSRNNSYVKDGKLHLRATLTDEAYGRDSIEHGVMDLWGTSPYSSCSSPQFTGCRKEANGFDILPPVQSARVQTMESFSFKYGRVEVKTKLPQGDWLWPGIWMMAKDNRYGPWPSSGELDIMESRGNGPMYTDDKGDPIGNNRFSACFHFGPAWNKDGYPLAVNDTKALPNNRSYGNEFHTFGFYWDDEEMYAYVDTPDQIVTRVVDYGKKSFWDIGIEAKAWNASDSYNNFQDGPINAPFDQEMYLIMNVAVGGTSIAKGFLDSGYFPDDRGGKPWHTNDSYPAANFYHQKEKWFPSWTQGGVRSADMSAMQIDSVKVWGIRGLTTFTESKNPIQQYDASSIDTIHTTNNEHLIFQDTFDQPTLDLSKWQHEISMTGSSTASFMHMTTGENAYVKDGQLVLHATLNDLVYSLDNSTIDLWGDTPATQCTSNFNHGCLQTGTASTILPPVISAMLRTEKSFSFRYGRVELRAKLPRGQWLRPVFRLLPKYDSYGEWPQSGEIVLVDGTPSAFQSRVQYGPFNVSHGPNVISSLDDDDVHLFGLYWDEDELYTYVDSRDNVVTRIPKFGKRSLWDPQWGDNDTSPWTGQPDQAPFDQLFYLSVGLRVGGTDGFYPDDNTPGKPWNDTAIDHKKTFLAAKDSWYPTWAGQGASLEIQDISVWATSEASRWAYHGAFELSPEKEANKLLFSDDFTTLEMRHWKPEITMRPHGEFQVYVNHRQTGYVRNHTLVLQPTLSEDIIGKWSLTQGYIDMWGTDLPSKCTAAAAGGCGHLSTPWDMSPPIHSASFRTAETFTWRYGRLEVKATLPRGDWLLPRIQLVPLTAAGWFDVVVAHGNTGSSKIYTGSCNSSVSCDVRENDIEAQSTHTYGIVWNESTTIVYLDSPATVLWQGETPDSLKHEVYLVVQAAVGGVSELPHYTFDKYSGKPWDTTSKAQPHTQFYAAKSQWWPSWANRSLDDGHTVSIDSALKIHSVQVWSVPGTQWRKHRLVGDPDVTDAVVQVKPSSSTTNPASIDNQHDGIGLKDAFTSSENQVAVDLSDQNTSHYNALWFAVVTDDGVGLKDAFTSTENQVPVDLSDQNTSHYNALWFAVVTATSLMTLLTLFILIKVGAKMLRRRDYTTIPDRV